MKNHLLFTVFPAAATPTKGVFLFPLAPVQKTHTTHQNFCHARPFVCTRLKINKYARKESLRTHFKWMQKMDRAFVSPFCCAREISKKRETSKSGLVYVRVLL
jgi:hypothetical protein